MRIRSIRPEFWSSEDIAAMDWTTRLVFIGLWSYVDDNGVGRDVEKLIVADLFPLEDDPSDTLATVSRSLAKLSEGGQITRYEADGKPYLHITSWAKHQRIDKAAKARYPLPTSDNAEPRETVATPSRDTRDISTIGEGEKGRRGEGEKEAPAKPKAPAATRIPDDFTVTPEMETWAREKVPGLNIEWATEGFIDYWQSATKNAVKKDWTATWRGWMRRNFEDGKLGPRGQSPRPDFGREEWMNYA